MVGMEGSAVLAVRKVVVVARAAEREVAEGAEAGSARAACVDGMWMVEVRAVEVRAVAVRAVTVSSAGALQPPRGAHQQSCALPLMASSHQVV